MKLNRPLKNYLRVAAAALKTGSKCSFIRHKLRFFARFCFASAASKTFFNGLLMMTVGEGFPNDQLPLLKKYV